MQKKATVLAVAFLLLPYESAGEEAHLDADQFNNVVV
jgi:hypothetical protein